MTFRMKKFKYLNQVSCELNQATSACLLPPQAKKAVLDLKDTLVGSYRSIEIPLVNNSPCPVSFHLSVQQILQDKEHIYDPETEPSGKFFCGICGRFTYERVFDYIMS